jgi:hypothetical protein
LHRVHGLDVDVAFVLAGLREATHTQRGLAGRGPGRGPREKRVQYGKRDIIYIPRRRGTLGSPTRSIRVKIDQEYLKKLLEACQASEKPTFNIEELKAAGFDYYDLQFEFHMMILADQGSSSRTTALPVSASRRAWTVFTSGRFCPCG